MQKSLLKKVQLTLAGIFFFNCLIQAQQVPEIETIEWSEDRPLTWADFPFKIFRSKRELALTSVKHSIRGYMKEGMPAFDVKVLFVRKDSWTSDTTSLELLAHEQLHFDIGELFRRKIEKRIRGLQKDGEKQKAIYRYVIKKVLSDFRIFSVQYDKETRHGNLKDEQKKWEGRVWVELKRLQ